MRVRNLSSAKTASNLKDVFFLTQQNLKFLNEEEKSGCKGLLNRKECLEALKSMAPEKTPGTDGLPCGFYTVFWNDLAEILVNA